MKVIKGIKKVTKTPGVKGRGTKSTTVSAPKSNVKVVERYAYNEAARAKTLAKRGRGGN